MIVGLLTMAAAQAPLRTACAEGDSAACEALAVELAARIVASDDENVQQRLGEVLRLLEVNPDDWARWRADPHRTPVCPGDYGCREPLPPSPPDGWTVGELTLIDGEPLWLLRPRTPSTSDLTMPQAPRLVVWGDGRSTLVDRPFCHAAFTQSPSPTLVGVTGLACDRFVHLGLDGEVLAELALPGPTDRVVSDGQTHLFERQGTVVDVDGEVVDVDAKGVLIGLFEGRPILGVERGQMRWPDGQMRQECTWYGQWLCTHRQLWWTLDAQGAPAEPVAYARPQPPFPENELPTGAARVFVSAAEPMPIAIEQSTPWSAVNAYIGGSRRLWAGELGSEPVGPFEVRSGTLKLGDKTTRVPPGTVHLRFSRRPRRMAEPVQVRVVDASGSPVSGVEVNTSFGTGTTDRRGRTEVLCTRYTGASVSRGAWLGSKRCRDEGELTLVLEHPRPRCTHGELSGFCDELELEGTFWAEQNDEGYVLERLVEPQITVIPDLRFELGLDETRGFARPGQELQVKAGRYCATVEAREEPIEVELEYCGERPVRKQVVDAGGEPVLAGGPDGFFWEDPQSVTGPRFPDARVDGDRLVLDDVPVMPPRPEQLPPDALESLVGVWFRDGSPVYILPDGKVITGSGEGHIDKSLPGIALVKLSGRSGFGFGQSDTFLMVVASDRKVLTLSRDTGLRVLSASPLEGR